jgi:hypothetical protein
MKFLKQLERRLGRFAIPNLTLYLATGQGLALLLSLAQPGFESSMLLIPSQALGGEWWRLFTFLFTPPAGNPLFAIFTLYLFYFMGTALENHWGKFRYNLYLLIAYVVTVLAAFIFPFAVATNIYIDGSVFLAFAQLYPEYQLYLFLVLPVRVKWLALLTWGFYALQLVVGSWPTRLAVLAAVLNFLVFFGRDIVYRMRHGHHQMRRQASAIAARDKPLRVCTVCGITDKTHPTMDFRYCSKCEPPVAYCTEHIRNHEHRGQPPAQV